jgi:hypothetical protein
MRIDWNSTIKLLDTWSNLCRIVGIQGCMVGIFYSISLYDQSCLADQSIEQQGLQ